MSGIMSHLAISFVKLVIEYTLSIDHIQKQIDWTIEQTFWALLNSNN